MKINNKRNRKPLIISLVIAAILIVAGAGYLFYAHSKQTQEEDQKTTNNVDYGPPTKEQEDAGNTAANSPDPNNVGSDRPTTSPTQENNKNVVAVTITSPADQSGSVVRIRASIVSITSSGTCALKLTKGATTVTKQVGVQALPSSSTCKGFDIPVSELSTGSWNAILTFENDASVGTATQTVTVH